MAAQVAGHVITKRAPGTLSFHMRQDGAAPAGADLDVSHRIHHLPFGTPAKVKGAGHSHGNDLADTTFASAQPDMIHEHTLQLEVATPGPTLAASGTADGAYEYAVETRTYVAGAGAVPAAKFTVQLPGGTQLMCVQQARHGR